MHGSPLSKFDNRDLWHDYDYRDFGIIGEPYFDVDYSEVLYLTDTGRRWDNSNMNVRDKVTNGFNVSFRSTNDIIRNIAGLPDKVMFNFHPQRWDNDILPWARELVLQNLKNVIKKYFLVKKPADE